MDQGRQWGDLFFPTGEVYPPENKGLFGDNLNRSRAQEARIGVGDLTRIRLEPDRILGILPGDKLGRRLCRRRGRGRVPRD